LARADITVKIVVPTLGKREGSGICLKAVLFRFV